MDTATDIQRCEEALRGGKGPVAIFGVAAAAKPYLTAALMKDRQVLFVTASDLAAERFYEDVKALCPRAELFLPRDTPLVFVHASSGAQRERRISALAALASGESCVVTASASALLQALAPKEAFLGSMPHISVGDALSPRALIETLSIAGYERVDMVEGRGQMSARGDLVDVYAPRAPWALRIEFFGDEIDQMRYFDPVTQRSVEQLPEITLCPALETPQPKEKTSRALQKIVGKVGLMEQERAWSEGTSSFGGDVLLPLLYRKTETLMHYLAPDALIVADEPLLIDEALRTEQLRFAESVQAMLARGEGVPEQGALECGANEALDLLNTGRTMLFYALSRTHPQFAPKEIATAESRAAQPYTGLTDELFADLKRANELGETTLIAAGERAESLSDELSEGGVSARLYGEAAANAERFGAGTYVLPISLGRGVSFPQIKLNILTEQELVGKADRSVKHTRKKAHLAFSELAVGDYIVHESHGVGRFVRVEALTVQGNTKDYLLIEYKGGDRLYIPTDQLDRIQKYVGGGEDEVAPALSKLGGTDWANRVARAKSAAKKLAVDLSALYAERIGMKGFAFSKDTAWQRTFEERFPYELTPDQRQSLTEIKADMEAPRPMDRLLCGDVGYGKTEVALRACFKAVQDGKQVALLVPTTILAQQHYATMCARFADFPIRAACLSRFRSPNERAEIKKKLASGEIDVVVGTHALLAKDVRFLRLGLLIVDEEHRFGVNHKEQIKAIKHTVDVLTLTATPIPRTLNMSMTGVRDISVIETPPEERFPVQTYVLEETDALLRDAISKELARKGQVFLVDNRVQMMENTARRIEKLVPEAQITIAHGQMDERALERAMLAFLERETNVLLCSTIIESGLDMPNVNTLIVLNADRMGLAQLYQLRGRVGRGSRIGYAYFTVHAGRELTDKAQKRLMAIREFTQFGAGFQLAMRDLEIRGAGSLLGAEQHGHISDVGYEYYTKLIRRAVDEQRGNKAPPEIDVTTDIPIDAHIPHGYVPSELLRLKAYRRIAEIDSEEAFLDATEEFIDRYGDLPDCVVNLMRISLIKANAARAYIESVTIRDGEAKLKFASDAQIDGGKLLMLMQQSEGAHLEATSPPQITLRLQARNAEQMTEKMPQFVHRIVGCVDGAESL